ncbi:hypothetical protein QAD02_018179 [Eretmocerus hayati]|uniref:Uncharacterized protein n=1 Tax=Eretmocerus hayati TaxID=131215 RepID=A0ACC2PGC0_9HYME|nr:hypothetical protein QAD02_018179 [Eretmocerus hayati]
MATFEPKPFQKNSKKLKCAVPGCKSNSHDNLDVYFHVIPQPNKRFVHVRDRNRKKRKVDQHIAWITALDIKCEVTKSLRVCSLHFKKEDYISIDSGNQNFRLLYHVAVPSCNLPHSNIDLIQRIKEQETKVANEWDEIKPVSTLASKVKNDCLDAFPKEALDQSPLVSSDPEPFSFVECAEVKSEKISDFDQCEMNNVSVESRRVETRFKLSNDYVQGPKNATIKFFEGALAPSHSSDSALRHSLGTQVNTRECKFHELLTSDKQLSTITGLRNFKILHRIVERVKLATDRRYEKNTTLLNTEDRVVMTFIKLKHDLSYSFIALMFECISEEECIDIFVETARIVYKYLDELSIPWSTFNLEKLLRNTLGLASNLNSSVKGDGSKKKRKVES